MHTIIISGLKIANLHYHLFQLQDILGDCSRMRIFNDSLRLSLVHHGYDALCVGNVIVQGVDGEFGRSREFKCEIPPQETIEYDTSAIYDCRPFDPDPARSDQESVYLYLSINERK